LPTLILNFMIDHVIKIFYVCSQRLKQWKSRCLGTTQLQPAVAVSRILYAIPAWGGFLSSERLKIGAFLHKAYKLGYTTGIVNVAD